MTALDMSTQDVPVDTAAAEHLVRSAEVAGRLADEIREQMSALSDAQLVVLRGAIESWLAPYHMVVTEIEQRSTATAPGPVGLTERQRQILRLLGDGLTVQAIAHRLVLSPRTVGKHLERLYRRLGTSDRLSTVLRAKRCGLLA